MSVCSELRIPTFVAHPLSICNSNQGFFLIAIDVAPPPDMETLLQEERRLDQELYRQSLSSEADSHDQSPVDRLDKALFLDQVSQ